MSKDSSAEYYQNNKERLQKRLAKDIKVLSREEKEKSKNMIVNDTRIYQKKKKKNFFSV